MESVGIILRHYSYSVYKIACLDQQLGRIDLILSRQKSIMVGGLMQYTAEPKKNNYFIKSLSLIDIPLQLAQSDLLFFHHVLELIYFFVPVGTPPYELFDLLLFLYNNADQVWVQHRVLKKIFLCKLLLDIGVYGEMHIPMLAYIRKIVQLPIDIIDPESLDLADEKMIDQWLQQCVETHPAISNFKTVHFLTKNRIL